MKTAFFSGALCVAAFACTEAFVPTTILLSSKQFKYKQTNYCNKKTTQIATQPLDKSNDEDSSRKQLHYTNPSIKPLLNSIVAASLFCTMFFSSGTNNNILMERESGGSFFPFHASLLQPPQASAAVAPLADVGLREFLVKDGKQFLRLGLPTSLPTSEDPTKLGDTGRTAQQDIELVRLRLEQVGFSGKTPVWNAALKDANAAKIALETPDMMKGISGKGNQKKAQELKEQAKEKIDQLAIAIRNQDITSTLALQEEAGAFIGKIRELSLTPGELSYKIPSEYSNLPRLRGRATVTCKLERDPKARTPYYTLADGSRSKEASLKLIIDGYHAPLTGGNFVDLVQRKFYDNMPIQTVGDLIVQTGVPANGNVRGFVDPNTKTKRTIPLELFYKKDKEPTYGYTSDDDLRATESFTLPFQATGALGMEYTIEDEEGVNSGSSEFWFLKWDQGLLAPGRNTLDGSHACFGYVVDEADVLSQVKLGDKIESMVVVDGSENFFPKA